VPRYQEHDIFISQDVPNNRLNALVVKYQAKGMVMHVMLDLPKEPNMQVNYTTHVPCAIAVSGSHARSECVSPFLFASCVKPGTCARL
jgi:hypothetical protein